MSKENFHTAIIIPGLGDEKSGSGAIMRYVAVDWSKYGLNVLVYPVLWRNGEEFEPKFLRLLAEIDRLSIAGKVSLIGASAGASMAFNAFRERKDVVHKAVNVCGRLRAGRHTIRSLDRMAASSIAFKQSVIHFQDNVHTLTADEKSRLMTIRPLFGDELVPRDTAFLDGAYNRWIYTPEHGLSIILSLLFPDPIISFLRR